MNLTLYTSRMEGGRLPCLDATDVHNQQADVVPIRVYDFFSGCGGTIVDLRQAGMNPVVALDMDSQAIKTFRLNFPQASTVEADIRKVSTRDLEIFFDRDRTAPILFSACAPCQPF